MVTDNICVSYFDEGDIQKFPQVIMRYFLSTAKVPGISPFMISVFTTI